MLVIQVCTFLVFWLKLNFLCVLVKLEMLGQTVSCFLEVWEPITNSLNSKPIFQRILLNMFKHTITQQEMLKITVLIKQGNVFWLCNYKLWTYFLEFSRQNCKTLQNNQTLQKSAQISYLNRPTIDFILEHVLCVFVYFVYSCYL